MVLSLFRNTYFLYKGYREFTKNGFLKHKENFDPNALNVDMSGKHCIVTGANSGLGYETARELATRGATVHIVCRNKEKGQKALEELQSSSKNKKIHLHIVDMSQPMQIKDFVVQFEKKFSKEVHALINNAGSMFGEYDTVTYASKDISSDSDITLEKSFATNTFGTYVLTESMIPLLERAGKFNDPSRVVTVSSGGMYTVKLDFNATGAKKDSYDGTFVYAQNKRQQVIMNEHWSKIYENKPILFVAMHPGWAATPGVSKSMPNFEKYLKNNLRTPSEGADTMVWLACTRQLLTNGENSNWRKFNGKFFFDREEVQTHFSYMGTQETSEEVDQMFKELEQLNKKF